MGLTGPSVVYFCRPERITGSIAKALEQSGYLDRLKPKKKIGLKVHFGEAGNRNHIRPEWVRAAAIAASRRNLQPVAVETTALYRGRRQNALDHIEVAREHGFGVDRTLVPVEILDGDRGERYYEVRLDSTLVPMARLAQGLRRYRYIVNLAHFKGHFVAGFGGVIKNLAMGLSAKAGKLEMHSDAKPYIDPQRCVSCGTCVDYCPAETINFVQYIARIGRSCTGCGGCLAVCPQGAIQVHWNSSSKTLQAKMVDYARAVLLGREVFHLNFCVRITPNCDCYPQTEDPAMPDAGLFASADPVACEQAAFDRAATTITRLYPHLTPAALIESAELAGLGTRRYRIVEL